MDEIAKMIGTEKTLAIEAKLYRWWQEVMADHDLAEALLGQNLIFARRVMCIKVYPEQSHDCVIVPVSKYGFGDDSERTALELSEEHAQKILGFIHLDEEHAAGVLLRTGIEEAVFRNLMNAATSIGLDQELIDGAQALGPNQVSTRLGVLLASGVTDKISDDEPDDEPVAA